MSTNELKRFPELPANEEIYVLDCFGGVRPNQREPDNPLLQCFFTPMGMQPIGGGQVKKYRRRNDQICVDLAVGYLPALFLGQIFRDQHRMPTSDWVPLEEMEIEFDSEATHRLTIADLGLKTPLTSDRNRNSAKRAHVTKVECTILRTNGKEEEWRVGKRRMIVFQNVELIRFYLTNSSFSCRKIFSGGFQKHRLTTDVININHEPVDFDPVTRAGRFVYRIGYSEKDAPALGRILFDESGYALQAAQQVHNSITADRINLNNGDIGYPSTSFPFKAKTTLSVTGRWLAVQGSTEKPDYIFLVHQILACSAPFPFEGLSYCCEVASGGGPAPDDAAIAFANITTVDKGPAHESPEVGFSKSDERPNAASATLDAEFGERRFDDLSGKPLKFEKLRDSTHRSQPRHPRYIETLLNASTGEGTSGESSSARQVGGEFVSTPAPLSADLETFLKILDHIQEKEKTWQVDTCPAGEFADTYHDAKTDKWFSLFPIEPCRKKTELDRKFSFMDKKKTVRKRLICAEIEISDRYFYLFEAQRRTDTIVNRLPILLLHRPGYEKVDSEEFLPMLIDTVINKTWPSQDYIVHFKRDTTPHGKGAQSPKDIARRIVEMVKRNLPKNVVLAYPKALHVEELE
jgi:hypothetical protein